MTSQTLPSRRLFLAAGSASAVFGALSAAAAAETGAPQEDTEIFRLAAALAIAFKHERILADQDMEAEEYFAAVAASDEIVEQMIVTPARTLAGVRAKAEALHWCHGDKFEGFCTNEPDDVVIKIWPTPTDMRLTDSILFDLLAVAGPVVETPRLLAGMCANGGR